MQLLSTASRIVWRGEENVRWTFLKTECLQVPWLHESVGIGELFDDLDDCTRCSRT